MLTLCCLGMLVSVSAQNETASNNKVSDEDIQRYVDAKLEIKYREATIEALELTKDEILAFDPIFKKYLDAKERMTEKKMRLLEDFREEMKEDDSVKNQNEDRADFIEDYWEVKIAESELRKDYFDILEDKIPVDKAAKFFLWEEMVEGQIRRNILAEVMPTFTKIEMIPTKPSKPKAQEMDKDSSTDVDVKVKMKDKKEVVKEEPKEVFTDKGIDQKMMTANFAINDFNIWVASSNRGSVDISHDYTTAGLKQLVKTLTAIDETTKYDIPNLEAEKENIISTADYLQKDPMSTDHADKTKVAFTTIATLINNMTVNGVAANKQNNLMVITERIDPNQLMTKQADHVYDFFSGVNDILLALKDKKYTKKIPKEVKPENVKDNKKK